MTGYNPMNDFSVLAVESVDVELLVPKPDWYLDTLRIGGKLFLCHPSEVGIVDQYGIPALIMSI